MNILVVHSFWLVFIDYLSPRPFKIAQSGHTDCHLYCYKNEVKNVRQKLKKCGQKKSPNVYKTCPKMITIEK